VAPRVEVMGNLPHCKETTRSRVRRRDPHQRREPVMSDLPELGAKSETSLCPRHRTPIEPPQDESSEGLGVRVLGPGHRHGFLGLIGRHRVQLATDITESKASVESFHGPSKNFHQPDRLFP
jgi:hypothetical protein